jgi:hemerythrin
MEQSWNEDLSVGGKKGDDEHRLQVELINALEEIVQRGGDPTLAERTMEQLADFSNVHFRSEELLMDLYAYAQLEVHKQEHGRFMEQLMDIRAKVAAGARSQALEAIRACRSTMIEHIRSMDQHFARLESAIKQVKIL